MRLKLTLVIIVYYACLIAASSQDSGELKQQNLRLYLSEDESSFAGLLMVNQIWTKFSWNNPGTLDLSGDALDRNFDIGLRRSRLVLYTQLFNRVFMYTQLAYDGMTYGSSRPPALSIINAVTEYYLVKDKLEVGVGLHTWNGVSRYSNSKLLEFLVIDNPAFVYPTLNTFDLAGRQLGIYAKGHLDRLHYRLSVNKPFICDESDLLEPGRTVAANSESLALKGYVDWQFMDKESLMLPYLSMNNLGSLRIFNVGFGFYFQPGATQSISMDDGSLLKNDIILFGADLFIDLPLRNKGIITSYLGLYSYDFGPGYIRSIGKMSTGTGGSLLQGPGVNEWETGTGFIARLEAGYLFPHPESSSGYQPFIGLSYKNLEALQEPSLQYDLGANMILFKNNIKLTMQYSARPLYEGSIASDDLMAVGLKGLLIFQTQFYF